jgi:hypothetical protein
MAVIGIQGGYAPSNNWWEKIVNPSELPRAISGGDYGPLLGMPLNTVFGSTPSQGSSGEFNIRDFANKFMALPPQASVKQGGSPQVPQYPQQFTPSAPQTSFFTPQQNQGNPYGGNYDFSTLYRILMGLRR